MKRTPKEVLKYIMQVQMGILPVTEVARRLGLSRKTYYEKEANALQAALKALTPKAPGRPSGAAQKELERLSSENVHLRHQLEALEQRIQIKEWMARTDTHAQPNQVHTMVIELVQRDHECWGWSRRKVISALGLSRATVTRWAQQLQKGEQSQHSPSLAQPITGAPQMSSGEMT